MQQAVKISLGTERGMASYTSLRLLVSLGFLLSFQCQCRSWGEEEGPGHYSLSVSQHMPSKCWGKALHVSGSQDQLESASGPQYRLTSELLGDSGVPESVFFTVSEHILLEYPQMAC